MVSLGAAILGRQSTAGRAGAAGGVRLPAAHPRMHQQELMTCRYFSCMVLAPQWAVAGGQLGTVVFSRRRCPGQQRAGREDEDAPCAEQCRSCGCHSSRARRLHPKYICIVACLKISGECFPIAVSILWGRSSPAWCFICRSDRCSWVQKRAEAASSRHTRYPAPLLPCRGAALPAVNTLTGCLQAIYPLSYRQQADLLCYYLIICLFILGLPGPFWIPLYHQFFLLIYKAKGKPCGILFFFFPSEARDLGRVGKNPDTCSYKGELVILPYTDQYL